ncbi:MAG: hypothetical protein V4727_03535 [Verrucomicrobiota bacterium]
MMKLQIFVITSLMACSGMGFSQTANPNDPAQNQNTQPARKGFWEANLAGGNYLVALSRITSVSRHKYVLDGAVIVDEVTVDTEGQSLARFYFISPVTAGAPESGIANSTERALEVLNNAATERGSSVQDMVQKKYPLTTHSKAIEYRVLTEAQLNALYQSVKTAWQNGDGRVYKAQ